MAASTCTSTITSSPSSPSCSDNNQGSRTRGVRKSVSFGEKERRQLRTYDSTLSEEERRASFYSSKQFEIMRGEAYGLAKTVVLLAGEGCDGAGHERVLRGREESIRGLEKVIPNRTTLNAKRRRNLIRSIVELHQMQSCPSKHEKAEHIKTVLEKYVQKHMETAKQAARERALGDEQEAHSVYHESKVCHCVGRSGSGGGGNSCNKQSVAAC